MNCPSMIGKEFVVTDFYHGAGSGVPDAPRSFPEIDFAGRSYFYGELLKSYYEKIDCLAIGHQIEVKSNAVVGYRFTVRRTK